MRLLLVSAICLLTVASVSAGDLKIKFVFGGEKVPPPKGIMVNVAGNFCANKKLVDESLVINPKNKGIKNVIVYVYTGRGGSKLPEMKPKSATHVLANKNCRFEPHVLIAQKGDILEITNPDPVGHNAKLNFLKNDEKNLMIPANQSVKVPLPEAEPAPTPVECSIHPWMKARVLVLDHPFGAASDENGELVIKGLPEEELVFRVFLEGADGSLKSVKVDGKETEWKKNRFEVDVKAGVNDMGTVTIDAKSLKIPK